MNDQSSHSQQGLLAAVGAAASRRLLPGTGGHTTLARLRGNAKVGPLGCRGRQDGEAGPLYEQASQAAAEDIRHPQV